MKLEKEPDSLCTAQMPMQGLNYYARSSSLCPARCAENKVSSVPCW